MATNYLEQLIAEWYEYKGYFVRRNVLVGKRPAGGYECELDIVAFNPRTKHLVHVEPSMDCDSWAEREKRFTKKFNAGRKYVPEIFTGNSLRNEVEPIAVLVYAGKTNHKSVGGGKVVLAKDLLAEIFADLRDKHLSNHAVPEHLLVLRSFQFVAEYRRNVFDALQPAK